MARNLSICRDEAEILVEIIEASEQFKSDTRIKQVDADLRGLFGMSTYEQQQEEEQKRLNGG